MSMDCPGDDMHSYTYAWEGPMPTHVPPGVVCNCGDTVSQGDGTFLILEDQGRRHEIGCECRTCRLWTECMKVNLVSGRCRCGVPWDDHSGGRCPRKA